MQWIEHDKSIKMNTVNKNTMNIVSIKRANNNNIYDKYEKTYEWLGERFQVDFK